MIIADPNMPRADKERIVRAFAYAIRNVEDYIVGPDMGTDETAMAWVHDVIHRCIGLPREIGGIPLDEIGATGFGLAAALDVAQELHDFEIDGARVVVQGFGSVGQHAARFLCRRGARLVGVSDSRGARAYADGFDVDALIAFKNAGQSVAEFEAGDALERDAVVDIESEIWIPAARPDVLRADNVARLNTKVVAEGANIPATLEAEEMLAERGILVIPDFIANAGGVICASVEYHGGTRAAAFDAIAEKIGANTRAVLEDAHESGRPPRPVAMEMAEARVRAAMALRRWG